MIYEYEKRLMSPHEVFWLPVNTKEMSEEYIQEEIKDGRMRRVEEPKGESKTYKVTFLEFIPGVKDPIPRMEIFTTDKPILSTNDVHFQFPNISWMRIQSIELFK